MDRTCSAATVGKVMARAARTGLARGTARTVAVAPASLKPAPEAHEGSLIEGKAKPLVE